jgi:hypothetical protein
MPDVIARAVMFVRRRLVARPRVSDCGQTTAEYALVLLGAAGVALMLVAWAAHSGKIGSLLDSVIGQILRDVR